MEIRLTPEQEDIIRRYMASGDCRTPESVLSEALRMLSEQDTMQARHTKDITVKPRQPETTSPLLQWLHDTAGPRIGLRELRRRLAGKIFGTMAQTVRDERDDRV